MSMEAFGCVKGHHINANSVKYAVFSFTTPQTVNVVAAVVVTNHGTLNYREVVVGCGKNNRNSLSRTGYKK